MNLENRSVIVTGAAQGIGYAIAERLLREGARVIVADIDDSAASAAVETLGQYGAVRAVHCDVSRRLDVRNLIAAAVDAYGSLDILVNNAGIVHKADFLEITEDDFDRVMATNLKGMFLCGQLAARQMVEQIENGDEPGAIVNLSSINSIVAIPDQVPYCVSKGGVQQLTKVMALSLSKYGIRVNAVGPGSIMTPMLAAVNDDPEAKARMMSRTPLGRLGDASDIASAVAFLASGEAAYIQGETLFVDGGRLGLNYTV